MKMQRIKLHWIQNTH